jgi:hypothetical protein
MQCRPHGRGDVEQHWNTELRLQNRGRVDREPQTTWQEQCLCIRRRLEHLTSEPQCELVIRLRARRLVLRQVALLGHGCQQVNPRLGKVVGDLVVQRLRPPRGHCDSVGAKVLQRLDVRLEIGVAPQPRTFARLGEDAARAAAPKRRRQRHAGQRDRVDAPGQDVNGLGKRGKLTLHRSKAVLREVQLRRHQHHPVGRDTSKLISVHVGVPVRNDIAEAIPGIDDSHRFSLFRYVSKLGTASYKTSHIGGLPGGLRGVRHAQ